MPTLQELREERKSVAEKAQEILDQINNEKREMTRAEAADFDKYTDHGLALTARIEREERLAKVQDRIEAPHSEAERPQVGDAEERAWSYPANAKKFRSFGEQLQAVRSHALSGGSQSDPRLVFRTGQGINEAVGSDGGFLVQPEFSQQIFKRAYETGQVASRCRKVTIGAQFNSTKIPAINESSRVDGSRWGGVLAYWGFEGGTFTASRPKFRMLDLTLKKLTMLCYATDEMLQDSQLLESVIMQSASEEMSFQVDASIIKGIGGAQPLGILNSPALVTVSPASGSGARVLAADIYNAYSRMWGPSRSNAVWFMNQDVEPQLYGLTLGTATVNQAIYLPPGGASGAPYSTLMGRQIVPLEQCATMGTVGDFIFADMSQYILADKGGVQTAASMHVAFLTDEQVFRFIYRVDGVSQWQAALTPYTGSSNTLSPFVVVGTRT